MPCASVPRLVWRMLLCRLLATCVGEPSIVHAHAETYSCVVMHTACTCYDILVCCYAHCLHMLGHTRVVETSIVHVDFCMSMAAPASSPSALTILCTCIHRGACTCTHICLSTVVCNDVSLHMLENKVHTHTHKHTHSPFPKLTQKQTTHTTTSTWPSQLFISMYINRSLIILTPNCYRYGKTAQE